MLAGLAATVVCLAAIASPAAAFTLNPGDILISNHGGSNVQRLDPTTGTVTTLTSVSGTPVGLAFDTAGNLYINVGNGIDKLDKATDTLSTLFTGNGTREGLAFDPVTNHLFSVSFGSDLIEEVDLSGNLVRTITIPGTTDLVGISIRGGEMAVTDNATGKVFLGSTTGSSFTQIGSVSSGSGYGVDFDSAGNIYANDFALGKVVKFTNNGGTYTASDFITGLSSPANGLSIGDDGSLTISEYGGNAVSVWNSDGTLRQRYPGVSSPDELVVYAPVRQSGAHTLTVTKTGAGSGSVTSSPTGIDCGSTCSAPYPRGTTVTLTATPQSGSVFAGWSGGGCSGTGTCTVTMNADTSVTATFNTAPPNTHTLTVKLAGGGKGKVTDGTGAISCPSTCSHAYATGTHVTLHASSAKGSRFSGWSGGGCTGTGRCSLTLGADTTVTATFTKVSVAPAGLRIKRVSSAAARAGCGTELAIIAALTDSQCTVGKLTVSGTINRKARGKVHLKITFNLGSGQQTATGDARIVGGHWQATLAVSGINRDPHPPIYTINAKFNGSKAVKSGHAKKQVTLEVETSAGVGPGKP